MASRRTLRTTRTVEETQALGLIAALLRIVHGSESHEHAVTIAREALAERLRSGPRAGAGSAGTAP